MRRAGLCALGVALGASVALAGCAGMGPLAEPPLWEQPPAEARDVPVVPHAQVHRERLENGLEVIVLEDPSLPWIEMGATARRGIGLERPEEAGLASLTAEVMQRGAGERNALELARVVDDLGASLRVGAGWDSTAVGVAGLSRDRDVLFDVLADVVRRPRFDADEVARARAEHRAGLDKAREDAATLASWRLARTLYPEHRYGLPEDGTPESVETLGAEELRDFHRRVFVPGDVIVHAVGDVDAEAFLARVRDAFGDWEPSPVAEPAPLPPETTGPRRIVVVDRPDLVQTQLRLGHEGIARDDERRIAAQLVNTVLGGGGFNSRLFQRVRADEGLTYGVGSGFSQWRRPGPFQVGTFTRNAEAGRVVGLVLEEIERLRSEPVPAQELSSAKSLRAGNFALALETSAAVAESLVELDVYGLPRDSLDTYRTRLRDVSAEEAAEVARELLHPDRAAIVAVGPADVLVPLLEPYGSVQVVQP
jgi:zinc protease